MARSPTGAQAFAQDIVFDCGKPTSLARFWADALDGYAVAPYDEAELDRLSEMGIDGPEDDPAVLYLISIEQRRSRMNTDPHPALHPETVAWLLTQLDERAREEFRAGLRSSISDMAKAVDESVDGELAGSLEALISYLDRWLTSVQVATAPGWKDQLAVTEGLITTGDGGVSSIDDLRRLLVT